MKKLLLIIIPCFFSIMLFAQRAKLNGMVNDTINKQNLSNAVISLLQSKDSILYKFTRSDAKGNFQFGNIQRGSYILLLTYPQYADYVDRLSVGDSDVDLGTITIIPKANLLKEIIIKQQISAIKMKGDTTEFAADSFKVQPNATVEDLLKQLPGIEVDKNGQITAQGEKVQKVLVDGEEFFGDDPTLVTKNLRADMVDKVQVYDKKSDQATFTGIDDGQKQKTINLKLKDDKKNGYFGKANASAGTDGYSDDELMFNDFKNKEKLAVYGIISNTGTSGLNWQDQNSYGQSFASNVDYDDANGYTYTGAGNDELTSWNGQYNGQGYPTVQTGGVHYNNKWDDDKQNANANYKILQLNVTGSSATNTETILPDTVYYNTDKQNFTNKILRNRVNGSYEYQIDSTSSIKITADGGDDHKITNSIDSTQELESDSSLINKGFTRSSTTGDNYTVNSNILWRKKLKKKGRTISFNLKENYIDNASTGYLYSANSFYIKGQLTQDSVTDQFKSNKTTSALFDGKLTYTEPLTKVSSLVFNYGVVVNNSIASINSYNKGLDGKYSLLDSTYSSDYLYNILTNKGGIAYSLFKKKVKVNFGTNVGYTTLNQKNVWTDSSFNRNFVNWYPQASFKYQFSQVRSVYLGYNGNTEQPTLQQIQPVLNNTNPLNITIGNAALKPAFANRINFGYQDYKVLTNTYTFTGVTYNFTPNYISNKSYVDSIGRTINQAINVNGTRSLTAYLDYGLKLKKPDLRIDLNTNINTSRYVNIVNNLLNVTNSGNYTFGLDLHKEKEKKYSADLNASATYTSSTSSIQESIQTQYWTFDIDPNGDIYLPKRFQIHSDCDFSLRQKTIAFNTNTNVILWNAWIGKKFMKNDALLVKIIANDILDNNIGFNRSVNSNFITQNTYSTIRRYFLLGVTWNFNKAGTKAPQNN